jgi:hypothetical protein
LDYFDVTGKVEVILLLLKHPKTEFEEEFVKVEELLNLKEGKIRI